MKLKDSDDGSPHVLELVSNRLLIDPKFNGYKLSLEQLPKQVARLSKCKGVDKVGPQDEQYSFLHVSTFAQHNFLIPDPWCKNSVYFVDHDWNIVHYCVNSEDDRLTSPTIVWTIPQSSFKSTNGRFNASLRFPHQNLALVADGCEILYLVETPSRNIPGQHWTVKEVFHSDPVDILDPLVLLEGRYRNVNGRDVVDCVFARVQEKAKWDERFKQLELQDLLKDQHAFVNIVEWCTLTKDESGKWALESRRRLAGRSAVNYCSLEEGATAIYIASDSTYYFVEDSENPVVAPRKQSESSSSSHANGAPEYVWSQDDNQNVLVWISTPVNFLKEQCFVHISSTSMQIMYKDQPVLEGQLAYEVNVDHSKWTIEDDRVHISLRKNETVMWSELIQGDKKGQEIIDPAVVANIHEKLEHLCTDQWDSTDDRVLAAKGFNEDIEECDVSSASTAVLMRLERCLHRTTHKVDLCSNPYLLAISQSPNEAPFVCLRNLTDGLVYKPQRQPQVSTSEGPSYSSFQLEHVSTFLALGYIQASKTQKKFIVAPPDFSYAAICDSAKHIYLYRQPSITGSNLRNRKSGENFSHISVQQIIAIDPPEEILGAYASDNFLFVLSASYLHAFRVKEAAEV